MKAERFILSLVAVVIGLVVAGGAFYLYQMTKTLPPQETKAITVQRPTPTPDTGNFLAIESPSDETVVNKKTISVSGKTLPGTTIVISSDSDDEVIQPSKSGSFSASHTIGDDSTLIAITAIFPNGEEQTVLRTVNFSTEDF